MPQIINTNIPSLNSQRQLNKTQSSLSTALERLSSGKRINSAKDDAAGLGISERMTSQINGMNQAIRNARDGISLAQTAEGALSTSGEMLQRVRTLAVQSSNATNASVDRKALQDEVSQLTAELNRIAQTTAFNGRKLLDGTMGTAQYQVGANAGELIGSNGMNFLTNTYGDHRVAYDGNSASATNSVVAGDLKISGSLGSKTITTTAGQSAREVAAMVNAKTADTGVTASAKTEQLLSFAGGTQNITLKGDNKDALTMTFDVAKDGTVAKRGADAFAQGINTINAQTAKTGVTAEYFDDGAKYGIKLTHATGETITIGNTGTSAITSYGLGTDGKVPATSTGYAIGAAGTGIVTGQIVYDSENSFSIKDASGIAVPLSSTTFTPVADQKFDSVTTTAAAASGLKAGKITYRIGSGADTTIDIAANDTASSIATKLNGISGLTATGKAAETTLSLSGSAGSSGAFTFEINGRAISVAAADKANQTNIQTAIGTQLDGTGITATVASNGTITLTAADAATNIVVKNTATDAAAGENQITVGGKTITTQNNMTTTVGEIGLSWADPANALAITDTDSTGLGAKTVAVAMSSTVTYTPTDKASSLHSVAELDISTFDKAQLALAIVDAAINMVNSERAKYGALQTRFESTISNLEVNAENTSNARSRIQDADYAQETASLSRASILQQAGTAMLAQANQLPQSVLSLIG